MNLVLDPSSVPSYSTIEVLSFLKKRCGVLEAVCITGGEPTLQKDLPEFIRDIRSMGYPVKLDTNGTNPDMLRSLAESGLIDYVAMDIKSSPENYHLVAGVDDPGLPEIMESISFLINGSLDYEFRTTVTSQYHTPDVIQEIGTLIQGAKQYYLQSFRDSDHVIDHSLTPCSKEELLSYREILLSYVDKVELRGV